MAESEQPERSEISLKTAIKSIPSALSASNNMRTPSMPMFKTNSSTGRGYGISLRKKSDLKKAMIANLIFSPPRAYDTSFDNTIVK